jgi:hypothetical protein
MIKTVFTTQLMARKQIFDQYGFTAADVLKDAHQVKADIVEQADKLPYGTLEHVLNLYSQLPLKGRLQYGSSNMIPFRAELDVIVDEILQTGEIRGKYAEFTSRLNMLTKNINTLNNAEISHLRQTEDNKLRVQLANTLSWIISRTWIPILQNSSVHGNRITLPISLTRSRTIPAEVIFFLIRQSGS